MSAPPDFQALARLYVELWQTQLGHLIGDPRLAKTMSDSFAAATAAMGVPPRPAAGPGELEEIRHRLDAIEARLAALEAPSRSRRKPEAKPGPG